MNANQIKQAVDEGKTIHWSNEIYTVIKDSLDQYLIKCDNGHCIGLTSINGELNGREEDFFIKKD